MLRLEDRKMMDFESGSEVLILRWTWQPAEAYCGEHGREDDKADHAGHRRLVCRIL